MPSDPVVRATQPVLRCKACSKVSLVISHSVFFVVKIRKQEKMLPENSKLNNIIFLVIIYLICCSSSKQKQNDVLVYYIGGAHTEKLQEETG